MSNSESGDSYVCLFHFLETRNSFLFNCFEICNCESIKGKQVLAFFNSTKWFELLCLNLLCGKELVEKSHRANQQWSVSNKNRFSSQNPSATSKNNELFHCIYMVSCRLDVTQSASRYYWEVEVRSFELCVGVERTDRQHWTGSVRIS